MDIKSLILEQLKKKGRVALSDILKQTRFSRIYIYNFFRELRDEGKIVLIGRANQAYYVAATPQAISQAKKKILDLHLILQNTDLQEDKVLRRLKNSSAILRDLPLNIEKIFDYAFTEMVNNAIDHSQSQKIDIKAQRLPDSVHFSVRDYGVGIFQNIMEKKNLPSALEAIGELMKGKQTTAPEAHSGEGIYFTSRVADRLFIKSGQKKLTFDNLFEDILVQDCPPFKGTLVKFAIALESKKSLEETFKAFTNNAFEFNKTHVYVRLFQMGREFVSRSQAKRILGGLDAFETIVLDFKGLDTVGQAFADEVFRVWKSRFPSKEIVVQNSNENIDFMIQRARQ